MTKLEKKLIELGFEYSMETYDYFTKQTIKRYSKQYNDFFGHIFVCEGKIVEITGKYIIEMQKDLEELKKYE
jgi:hypothetical protein